MFLNTHVVLPEEKTNPQPEKNVVIVDVGGTFLKVCALKVTIDGKYEYVKEVRRINMEEEKHSNCNIWILITNLLKQFMEDMPKLTYEGSLTISFPVEHSSLSNGKIIDCGKDFKFDKNTFIGANPVKSLNYACLIKGVNLVFKTVMNDATATAVASYFTDKNTLLGIVLGTGTNGAFIQKCNNKRVIINSEWAAFDHPLIKRTVFDAIVINGLAANELSFNLLDVLLGGFKIVQICRLYAEYEGVENPKDITLQDMLNSVSHEQCTLRMRKIRDCFLKIKYRRSQLLAALILGTVKVLVPKEKDVTICLNGSVFENEDDRRILDDELSKLLDHLGIKGSYNIRFNFIRDGSLLGCAFSVFL